MMVIFRLLPALLLLLTTLPAKAAEKYCHQLKTAPTTVTVNLDLPKPFYDLTKGFKAINEERAVGKEEWLEKNGMEKVWRSDQMATLGYAEGGAAMISGGGFEIKSFDKYGVYYCLYITHVDVAMIFRTRIVIPKEFKKGGCRFNAINEHELRHYQANGETAIKFTERLEKDLPIIVAEAEKKQPYVLGADAQSRAEELKASVMDAIESYIIMSMRDEMKRVNGLIDTPEEYAASGPKMKACQD